MIVGVIMRARGASRINRLGLLIRLVQIAKGKPGIIKIRRANFLSITFTPATLDS